MTSPALEQLAGRVRGAARLVARSTSSTRDDALRLAADLLDEEWPTLVEANAADLERAEEAGMVDAARDRLRLTEARVRAMAEGLRKVAGLPDPVGEVTEGWVRPNGLRVSRVRVPLGVVGVIYENRPNVTSDAAALCLKAGNAAFLRGSSAAITSNRAIATVPYVIDGDGNCHVYVDRHADLAMASAIVVNGKTSRPSVCNATESL